LFILSSLSSHRRFTPESYNFLEDVMSKLLKLLIPLSIIAMSGCVVAPYGYHRGYYYGPRVAVVAPAPVVVVRP
jgi:hypothetical protein